MEAQPEIRIRDGRIENMLCEDEVGACCRDVKYFHPNRVSWGDESSRLEGAAEVNIHAGENAQTEDFYLLNMKIEVESDTETDSEFVNNAGEIEGPYDYDYNFDENSSSSSGSFDSSGSEWENPSSSVIRFPLPPALISQPIWSEIPMQFSQLQMETDSEDSGDSFVNDSGFHDYNYNFTDGTLNPRSFFPGSSTCENPVPSFVGLPPGPVSEPLCTGTPMMEYYHLEMDSDSESENLGDVLVDESGVYDDNSCGYNLKDENSITRFVFSGPNNACENSNSFVVDFVPMPEREHNIWTESPVEYSQDHQAEPEADLGNSGNVSLDESENYDISYNLDGNYITRVVLPGRSENHTPFVIDFVPASAPEPRNLGTASNL